MRFIIQMSVTVEVRHEPSVMLAAAARVLGDNWDEPDGHSETMMRSLSSIEAALCELAMPEQAFAHVFGIDVDGSVVHLPRAAHASE